MDDSTVDNMDTMNDMQTETATAYDEGKQDL